MDLRIPLLVLILLGTTTAEVTIDNINIKIEDSGYVHVTENIALTGNNTVNETIWVPKDIEGISISDNSGELKYDPLDTDGKKLLTLYFQEIKPKEKRDIVLKYGSRYFTSKSAGVWTLRFHSHSTAWRTIVKINFPPNSTIKWTPVSRFSMGPDTLYIYPETDEFNFTGNYEFVGGGGPSPNTRYYYAVSAVVLIIFLVLIRRKIGKKKKEEEKPPEAKEELKPERPEKEEVEEKLEPEEQEKEKIEEKPKPQEPKITEKRKIADSVYRILEDNERKIIDILIDADEEITQAQICRETMIPKATLSDIMRRLEKRNIIERTREGRRNWIKLKDGVLE